MSNTGLGLPLVSPVSYVPVKQDLSNLRERYHWTKSHPEEARKIAEAGTRFARWMGTPHGFARLHHEHIVEPLGNVIGAYKKPRKKHGGKRVLDILAEGRDKGEEFSIVARCGGWPGKGDGCRWTAKDDEGGTAPEVAR